MRVAEHEPEFRFRLRVYYEDTDCMGVVYHANYLRFFERARTEALAESGASVVKWAERGVMFPVYSIQATFRAPAHLGDDLVVVSRMCPTSPFRVTFDQRVEHAETGKLLVKAQIEIVCCDLEGKLQRMPDLGL
ncbi:MAG TPA: acyl-CoA thioesterase [Myxococcales bacterium]|jgi:acyl-CoA thioester hydrolase|nr:acyl-CoA thioesterase [Myxococcales bacterium]